VLAPSFFFLLRCLRMGSVNHGLHALQQSFRQLRPG
jgi:hypothetical protein